MKQTLISKIAFILAWPATMLAYVVIVTSFVLPAISTYSAALYGEHSAKTGRILKTDHLKDYPEKPTTTTETFKNARERAKLKVSP